MGVCQSHSSGGLIRLAPCPSANLPVVSSGSGWYGLIGFFGLYMLPSAYPNAQDLIRLAGIGYSRFWSPRFVCVLIGFPIRFLISGLSLMQAVKFSANTSIFLTRISCILIHKTHTSGYHKHPPNSRYCLVLLTYPVVGMPVGWLRARSE